MRIQPYDARDLLTWISGTPVPIPDLLADAGIDMRTLHRAIAALVRRGVLVCEQAGFIWVHHRDLRKARVIGEKFYSAQFPK